MTADKRSREKFEVISKVEKFIERSLQHKDEYLVEVLGVPIIVIPQVMSPKYSFSPQFIIKNWDVEKGHSVLDIGTGCGILGVFAGLKGASKIVASDINPKAVECAKKNFELNKLNHKSKVILSDCFSKIKNEKFDRIIFNAPYWNRKADQLNPLTYGVYDENYKSTKSFLKDAKNFIKKDGKILLGFAFQDDVQFFEEIIKEEGYIIEKKIIEVLGHARVLYYLV